MRQFILGALAAALTACGNPGPAPSDDDSSVEQSADEVAVRETLDSFYASAAAADFEYWIGLFTPDSMFYGTDATEAWPRDEFAEGVKEGFDAGVGWDFEVRNRKVSISPDGNTAWFADLAYFNNTGYLLRPTGVLIKKPNGDWRFTQLVMGVPFPNEIYDGFLAGLQATERGAEAETADVETVLNSLHDLADKGAFDDYFALFTEDAIYMGTDASEHWTMDEFKAFATPYFADGHGWTYEMTDRHIFLSPMKNIAWFDELLFNESFGQTRGTGVMVRTRDGWKISQYNLTFTVPNDIAADVVAVIKGE